MHIYKRLLPADIWHLRFKIYNYRVSIDCGFTANKEVHKVSNRKFCCCFLLVCIWQRICNSIWTVFLWKTTTTKNKYWNKKKNNNKKKKLPPTHTHFRQKNNNTLFNSVTRNIETFTATHCVESTQTKRIFFQGLYCLPTLTFIFRRLSQSVKWIYDKCWVKYLKHSN